MKNIFEKLRKMKILRKIILPIKSIKYRIKVGELDYSIISNNCWGGMIFSNLHKKYNSPTVGLYFFSDEYIKFLKNINY